MMRILQLLAGLATASLAVAEPRSGVGAAGGQVSTSVSAEAIPLTIPELPSQVNAVSSPRSSAIPEPMSLAVFGTGLLLLLRRRRF